MASFASRLIAWQKRHGRRDLPWQGTRDPYAIWISEIMLQQTQVATVIPYYQRFLARFPDLESLAGAELDEVLALWSGLGYYSRARNLHRAAQAIACGNSGEFPRDPQAIASLPGIGRSTAAAIAAFAFGARCAILDGNVKRVLCRCFGIEGYPGEKKVEDALWRQAERCLPRRGIEIYTQALMDLGATVCTRAHPRCDACPVKDICIAFASGRVHELPSPRPRRRLPEKRVRWLVLTRKGEVLLEKRPPSGLWGGLWCFPETSEDEDPRVWCRSRYGLEAGEIDPLPPFKHGFSHFTLSVSPFRLRVEGWEARAMEPGALWLNLEAAQGAALPSPVRRLLRCLE